MDAEDAQASFVGDMGFVFESAGFKLLAPVYTALSATPPSAFGPAQQYATSAVKIEQLQDTGIVRAYIFGANATAPTLGYGTAFFVSPSVMFLNDHGVGEFNPQAYYISAPPYPGSKTHGAADRSDVLNMPAQYLPVTIKDKANVYTNDEFTFCSGSEIKVAEVKEDRQRSPVFYIPSVEVNVGDYVVIPGIPAAISEARFKKSYFGSNSPLSFPLFADHTHLFRHIGLINSAPGQISVILSTFGCVDASTSAAMCGAPVLRMNDMATFVGLYCGTDDVGARGRKNVFLHTRNPLFVHQWVTHVVPDLTKWWAQQNHGDESKHNIMKMAKKYLKDTSAIWDTMDALTTDAKRNAESFLEL